MKVFLVVLLFYIPMNKSNLFLVFCLLVAFSCQSPTRNDEVTKLIEELKAKHAPDKRVALWNITFENDSLKGETNLPEAYQELIAELEAVELNFINAVKQLPDSNLGDQTKALVTISVANIRSQPKHSAELATQALMGTPLTVLKEEDGWFLVQTPDQYVAWIDRAGIQLLSEAELEAWYRAPKLVFTDLVGYVWETADGKEMVSDLVAGDLLTIENESSSHYFISLPDKRKGWVSKSQSQLWENWIATRNTNPETLINTAKQMMGTPYLWGGTSIKGMDCSGFTKTIFYLNGQIIPRDASQQINEGELIDADKNWEKLQVGDLLFFGEKATEEKKERVVHVGMWIGNGEFIHARGLVRISSFDPENPNYDEYEFNRYLRTKRIVNVPSENIRSVANLTTKN